MGCGGSKEKKQTSRPPMRSSGKQMAPRSADQVASTAPRPVEAQPQVARSGGNTPVPSSGAVDRGSPAPALAPKRPRPKKPSVSPQATLQSSRNDQSVLEAMCSSPELPTALAAAVQEATPAPGTKDTTASCSQGEAHQTLESTSERQGPTPVYRGATYSPQHECSTDGPRVDNERQSSETASQDCTETLVPRAETPVQTVHFSGSRAAQRDCLPTPVATDSHSDPGKQQQQPLHSVGEDNVITVYCGKVTSAANGAGAVAAGKKWRVSLADEQGTVSGGGVGGGDAGCFGTTAQIVEEEGDDEDVLVTVTEMHSGSPPNETDENNGQSNHRRSLPVIASPQLQRQTGGASDSTADDTDSDDDLNLHVYSTPSVPSYGKLYTDDFLHVSDFGKFLSSSTRQEADDYAQFYAVDPAVLAGGQGPTKDRRASDVTSNAAIAEEEDVRYWQAGYSRRSSDSSRGVRVNTRGPPRIYSGPWSGNNASGAVNGAAGYYAAAIAASDTYSVRTPASSGGGKTPKYSVVRL